MNAKIQHLLVLMMENRSFDHMLGYLDYPPEAGFEGVRGRESSMPNPLPDGTVVYPSEEAQFDLGIGPGHSHDDVMQQLLGTTDRARPYHLANNGFAANYDQHNPGHGRLAVECFNPERVPVLATLAQHFALCDHWHCSVPGATWPNRNFAHAGTSDGEVNIRERMYYNPTIFEQLSDGHRDWAVYYDGFPPESLAFARLWSPFGIHWLQRFKPIEQLYRAIRLDHLPHYGFIEPNMIGKLSDSQHPGQGKEMDFRAGEHLIWRIYDTLRRNPEVFKKTLLVVTYDEHGGLFDHVPPPLDDKWKVDEVYKEPDTGYTFPFDLLGLRVPTVMISPWIEPLTLDSTLYDHTSIPATVGKLFDVDVTALSKRVQVANTFEQIARRDGPRTDLPDLPEPIVDDSQRVMVPEPDLRPSLTTLAADLIWTELRPRQLAGTPSATAKPTAVPAFDIAPEDAHQTIMQGLAPGLSPAAQAALATPPAPTAAPALPPETTQPAKAPPAAKATQARVVPGVHAAIAMFKQHAAELAARGLVDDLGAYADWVMRVFFGSRKLILRTAGGASVEQPDAGALGAALDELFEMRDPAGRVWLADYEDRWLTVYGDGRATFLDRGSDQARTLPQVDRKRALELFALLEAGEVRKLHRALKS